MSKEIMITTVDNPYNPFEEWEKWLLYDTNKGYHTCERLASVTAVSDQDSDEENFYAVEQGINELIKTGALNKNGEIVEFKKVVKEVLPLKHSEDTDQSNSEDTTTKPL